MLHLRESFRLIEMFKRLSLRSRFLSHMCSPWKLKGRAWIFGLSGLRTKANFPAGFSANYQAEALAGGGEFIGGLGLVQVRTISVCSTCPYTHDTKKILSYSDSPVGKLLFTPSY